MKRIHIPDLSLRASYALSMVKFGHMQLDEIIFAYDGVDFIAWLQIYEINEPNNVAYAKVVGSSYMGE